MVPTNKTLTNEERIKRLKESRQKYSQISKAKTNKKTVGNGRNVAPTTSRNTNTLRSNIVKPISKRPVEQHHEVFEPDPEALNMIKTGKVTIPRKPSQTMSSVGATMLGRTSISGKRFRNSVAMEPRQSLLPLGINLFDASANQRREVSNYFNSFPNSSNTQKNNTFTPVRQKHDSCASSSNVSTCNQETKNRSIRFMPIVEQRESTEANEILTTPVRHSPRFDNDFVPTSILSTKKNRKINSSENDPESKIDDILKFSESLKNLNENVKMAGIVKIKKIIENFNEYIKKQEMCEAFHDTLDNDTSRLRFLQGSETYVKTPKAFKEFHENIKNVQPFNELINKIIKNTVDEVEENEDDDESVAPLCAKRRSSKGVKVKHASRRISFKRRSSRLHKVQNEE